MRTIKLTIEYDGTDYVGWQFQPNGPSIQGEIESALEVIAGETVQVVSSGRTDAGVHARGMVAHFQTSQKLPLSAFREGVNSHLPPAIAIVESEDVAPEFHARFGALAKKYRYTICQSQVRLPLSVRYAWHQKRLLDVEQMRLAAEKLVGHHDFAAFRSSGCDASTTEREIYAIEIGTHGPMIQIDVIGSGFLRNMIRIIAGTLVEVGQGNRSFEEIDGMLQSGQREHSGITAPPHGLCLMKVWYDGDIESWINDSKRCNSCQKSLDIHG